MSQWSGNGPEPVSHPGFGSTPPAGWRPHPSWAPPNPGGLPQPPPPSGLPSWAVVLIGVGVALLVLPIIGAVVLPLIIKARGITVPTGQAATSSLALPETLDGVTIDRSPAVWKELAEFRAWSPRSTTANSALFGSVDRGGVAVLVSPGNWSPSAQQAFTREFLARSGATGVVDLRGPGGSNGYCANVQGVSTCWTTGPEGAVVASVIGQGPDPAFYPALLDVRIAATCECSASA